MPALNLAALPFKINEKAMIPVAPGHAVGKGWLAPTGNKPLGTGYVNPATLISARLVDRGSHALDRSLIVHRLNIALSLRHSLEEAFNEDLAIIEAQQKVFDADPNYQLLAIGADAALTYFRWVLARRIEAEKSAATAA